MITSSGNDVSLEIDDRPFGIIQNYQASSHCAYHPVYAYGSVEPIAFAKEGEYHHISCSSVLLTSGDFPLTHFTQKANFTFTIRSPKKVVTYTGCQWEQHTEESALEQPVLESLKILATHKTERVV